MNRVSHSLIGSRTGADLLFLANTVPLLLADSGQVYVLAEYDESRVVWGIGGHSFQYREDPCASLGENGRR